MTTLGCGRVVSAHVTDETNFGTEGNDGHTKQVTPDEELAVVVVLAFAILDFSFLSFWLCLKDALCLIAKCTVGNGWTPRVTLLSLQFPVLWINIEAFERSFQSILEAFLRSTTWPFPRVQFTKEELFLEYERSSILITWPDHLSWYFISMVWILIMLGRERTSVSGILSCHLILSIFLRQFRWKRFRVLACRW